MYIFKSVGAPLVVLLYVIIASSCSTEESFGDFGPAGVAGTTGVVKSVCVPTACTGVDIFPADDAVSVIESNPAGTIFCFKEGVHNLSAPINARSHDQFIGECGSILDGQDSVTHAILGRGGALGQTDVTVRNLIIQNFRNVYDDFLTRNTVKTGENWVVENNEIRNNYEVGIHFGTGNIVRNNYIHHNGRYGYTVGPGLDQNLLIDGNEIAFNNTRDLDWATAGTGKVVGSTTGTTGITWINNWVHDNNGHGIHHDANVGPGIEIAFNLVENNQGSGIHHEASWGVEIHDNVVINNAKIYLSTSCFHGSQIHGNNSSDMNVYNNYVESSEGANGICFVDTDSGNSAPFSETVTNAVVTGNVIRLAVPGSNGLVHNGEFAPYDTTDVLFDRNTYYVTDPDLGTHWAFTVYPVTKSEWQAAGQDINGTFLAQ